MEAGEEIVHAEIRNDDGYEGDGEIHQQVAGTSERRKPADRVEREGVDQESDEGPGFFRIPSPVASPRLVGPDGADEDAGGKKHDGRVE